MARNDAAEPARVALLACDAQQSVMSAQSAGQRDAAVYSPYGHRDPGSPVGSLGFNGELPESVTGHYLLGNGYRAYNPVLMRFNQPDSWSPFGAGGLNPYVYCIGDPVNRRDPTGHTSWSGVLGVLGLGLSVVTWGASMPLALAATTVGVAGTAVDVAERRSEELSLMHWVAIGVGVASVLTAGGTIFKKRLGWGRHLNSQRQSVIEEARSSVIKALPEENLSPSVQLSPQPVPSPPPSAIALRELAADRRVDELLRQKNTAGLVELAQPPERALVLRKLLKKLPVADADRMNALAIQGSNPELRSGHLKNLAGIASREGRTSDRDFYLELKKQLFTRRAVALRVRT